LRHGRPSPTIPCSCSSCGTRPRVLGEAKEGRSTR
jgi:hypothetical protein